MSTARSASGSASSASSVAGRQLGEGLVRGREHGEGTGTLEGVDQAGRLERGREGVERPAATAVSTISALVFMAGSAAWLGRHGRRQHDAVDDVDHAIAGHDVGLNHVGVVDAHAVRSLAPMASSSPWTVFAPGSSMTSAAVTLPGHDVVGEHGAELIRIGQQAFDGARG